MAQQLLLRAIKKQVSSYAGDLDAQVQNGELSLSNVEIRPRRLLQGLWLFGSIADVKAEWCWKRLLTSRFEVRLSGVTIVVRLPPQGVEWPLKEVETQASSASATASSDAAEENFVQRLKRRIWDRLQIRVSNLQVRFECYGSKVSADGLWQGSCCGVVAQEWAISPQTADPGKPIWQTVALTNGGAFAKKCEGTISELSSVAGTSPPSEDDLILSRISPYCSATRHGGRRFVDWRGLEVDLHIPSPRIKLSRQNWLDAMEMIFALSGPGFKAAVEGAAKVHAAACAAVPSDEIMAQERSQSTSADASSDTWRRWIGNWWSSATSEEEPPPPGKTLPPGVSDTDTAVLLEEEKAPSSADTLKLDVEVETATVDLPDVELAAMLSAAGKFTLREKGWSSAFCVREVEVREGSLVADATVALARLPQEQAGGSSSSSRPPLVEIRGEKQDGIKVNLDVSPILLRLSRHLVEACKDGVSVFHSVCGSSNRVASSPESTSTSGLADSMKQLNVQWKVAQIELKVAKDLFRFGDLVSHFGAEGSIQGMEGVTTFSADLELQEDLGNRRLLAPVSARVAVMPDLVAVTCEPVRCVGQVRDWLALLHAAIAAKSACTTWLMPPRPSSEESKASGGPKSSKPLTLEVKSLDFCMLDQHRNEEWTLLLEPISVKVHSGGLVCYMPQASLTNAVASVRAEWQASLDLALASGSRPEGILAIAAAQLVDLPSNVVTLCPAKGGKAGAFMMVHINDTSLGASACSLLDVVIAPRAAELYLTQQTLTALKRCLVFIADVKSAVAAIEKEAKTSTASSSSSSWSVRWRQVEPILCIIGDGWLPDARFVLDFTGEGLVTHRGNCELTGKLGLSVKDATAGASQGAVRWMEPSSFTLDITPTKISFDSPALCGRCALVELLPVMRALRRALTEKPAAAEGSETPSALPALHANISVLTVHITDSDESECLLQGRQFELAYAGLFSMAAKHLEAKILSHAELQGCVQLTEPLVTLKFEKDARMFGTVKSGQGKILDGEGHQAVVIAGVTGGVQLQLLPSKPSPMQIDGALDGMAHIDTTKEFLLACKNCGLYIIDALATIWMGEPIVFTEHPIGLDIQDGKVAAPGLAARQGIASGWQLVQVDPPVPDGTTVSNHFTTCKLPAIALFAAPPRIFNAKVEFAAFPLTASLRTRWGIEVGVEKASLTCGALMLQGWTGTGPELSQAISDFYLESMKADLPRLVSAACIGGVRVNALTKAPLKVLKIGGEGAAAVGGGVVKGISTVIKEGRQQRGADQGYQFGDVTRGMVALAPEGVAAVGKEVGKATKGVAGEISQATKGVAGEISRTVSGLGREVAPTVQDPARLPNAIGNIVQGIAAEGRKSRGGEPSGKYQFGDVTKGLFSNFKRRG